MVNHYEILGVEDDCTRDEIKKAYREMVKRYHPDKTGNDLESGEMFKKVQLAYETLYDDNKRIKFDLEYQARKEFDIEKAMSEVWDNMTSSEQFKPNEEGQYVKTDPERLDISARVAITLDQIYSGEIWYEYDRKVPDTRGVLVETKECINLQRVATIVLSGFKPFYSWKGMGHHSSTSNRYGDLNITFDFKKDPRYKIVWEDLMLARQEKVNVMQLIRDDGLIINHLGNNIHIPLEKFKRNKNEFEVKSGGIPDGPDGHRGPLLLQVFVDNNLSEIPEDLKQLIQDYYSDQNKEQE